MSFEDELASFPRRTPVLDGKTVEQFPAAIVERQWGLVTEKLRRLMVSSVNVQAALVSFVGTPVTQHYPHDVFQVVASEVPVFSRLLQKESVLNAYLALADVPEEEIRPDVTRAEGLRVIEQDVGKEVEFAHNRGETEDTPQRQRAILETITRRSDDQRYTKGITYEESHFVSRKRQYSGDVKILALGAELLYTGIPAVVESNGDSQLTLPSGVSLLLSTQALRDNPGFLSPQSWERKQDANDRLFRVRIGGREYMLKERKTKYHRRTLKEGHRPGHTSQEEYEIGKELASKGKMTKGPINVVWEKPFAAVTYPDGYQFAIFSYEHDLIDSKYIRERLTRAVLRHRDVYEGEYRDILARMAKYINDTRVDRYTQSPDGLSFEQYARVKSHYMAQEARFMQRQALLNRGFIQEGKPQDTYRIIEEEGGVTLEVVGLDYEYMHKIDLEDVSGYQQDIDRARKADAEGGIRFTVWNNIPPFIEITKAEQAAFLVMVERQRYQTKKLV